MDVADRSDVPVGAPDADTATAPPFDAPAAGRRDLLVAFVAAVVVLLPALVALVALARPTWYPTGDLAQAELHVRAFWSDPPLVGAAGRIASADGVQGAHPGPALWLAMWPLYALGGGSSFALMVSVTVVHLVTAALALWMAHRRGGIALVVIVATTLLVAVRAGGPEVLTEPWNPWMALLPFVVLLLALWSVLVDDLWLAPLAVVAGSYCVQAHAGYLVIVGGLLLGVAAVVLRRHWRDGRRAALGWLGASTAVGVLVWVPPLVDQLRREPGNLSILRESFGRPDGPYLGVAEVAEIVVVQLNLLGPWVLGPARESFGVLAAVGFVGAVALWAAGARAARRRGAADELALHGLLAAAWVLAVVSISRIFGRYFEYTVRWLWFLTVLTVSASVWSLWRSRPRGADRPGRGAAVAALAVGAAVLGIAVVQFAVRAEPTGAADGRIVGGLVPEVVDDLDRDARHLLRWWDPTLLGATGFGAALELERRGFDVALDQQFAAAVMPHRVLAESDADAVLYLVLGEGPIERARATPGVEELGAFDVRTPEQRTRSAALRAEIEAELTRSGQAERIALLDAYYGQAQLLLNEPRPSPELEEMLEEYIDLRQPAALFRTAPGTPVLPL